MTTRNFPARITSLASSIQYVRGFTAPCRAAAGDHAHNMMVQDLIIALKDEMYHENRHGHWTASHGKLSHTASQ